MRLVQTSQSSATGVRFILNIINISLIIPNLSVDVLTLGPVNRPIAGVDGVARTPGGGPEAGYGVKLCWC